MNQLTYCGDFNIKIVHRGKQTHTQSHTRTHIYKLLKYIDFLSFILMKIQAAFESNKTQTNIAKPKNNKRKQTEKKKKYQKHKTN